MKAETYTMTSFARFALVFTIVLLVALVLGAGPFSGLSLVGGILGAIFGLIASVIGTLFGLACGLVGLLFGAVVLVVPALILLSPLLLVVGLVALVCRLARN